MPRRLRVTTCFDYISNMVSIAVADNGPGIPEQLRKRIFEPYFTTKPMGVGTGVGLAVSLGIVEAYGGTLTAACPLDGGAVFMVRLPAGELAVAGEDAQQTPKAPTGQRTILIVDDEADVRETLTEILTSDRHRVVSVASGREALERINAERYDVILTDVRMPDLDGQSLYNVIVERWPKQAGRVIFVTGDTLASALREFVSQSGRPVIEKPFLPSDVRRVVDELVTEADGGPAE